MMDDKNLLAAVREDFAGVKMITDAEAVMADGGSLRRRRNRHRVYGAGVTALAAVAAISGVTLASGALGTSGASGASGASGTSGTSHAQLTAWTVQKQTDGTIDVTIHDLLHLAGLQQKLNADGVPAEVVTDAHYPASCVNYPAMNEYMASVITLGPGVPDGYAFVIHPADIPSGSKLLLDVTHNTTVTSGGVTTTGGGVGDRLWGLGASSKSGISLSAGIGLVYANGNC
jgi:hypothetical protein